MFPIHSIYFNIFYKEERRLQNCSNKKLIEVNIFLAYVCNNYMYHLLDTIESNSNANFDYQLIIYYQRIIKYLIHVILYVE